MENYRIYKISISDFKLINNSLEDSENTRIIKINGKKIKKWSDYSRYIADGFEFPYGAEGYDGYNDWINDLDWLTVKGIINFIIVIEYFTNDFLREDSKSKEILSEMFIQNKSIWDDNNSYEDIPRTFTVYLVD